ncbi:hypothetical protein I215_01763 [Galbibacter marinus]|uniref:Uncharacterized protein n=1 Tax=Galbibacter marinus TaxID=555500 RepID=K2PXQ3_9FLAO|nr:hypothetical protein I215_01763 [Galbibacter marinus]
MKSLLENTLKNTITLKTKTMEQQSKIHEELLRNNRIIAILCVTCVSISLILSAMTAHMAGIIGSIEGCIAIIGIILIVMVMIILGITIGARSATQIQ